MASTTKKTPCKQRHDMGPPPTWWEEPVDDTPEAYATSVQKARAQLIEHAKAAMQVEFNTIPLYLYSAYSVIPDHGGPASKARFSILGVVEQEMLHLSLGGNILRALNGTQKLYEEDFIPVYDNDTFLLFDEIQLRLSPLKKPLIETFIKIESPWEKTNPDLKPDPSNKLPGKAHIAKGYYSIGQFYAEFEEGIKIVTEHCPEILRNNANVQFTPDDFFGDAMTVVQDRLTALKAMKKIVDQGEGATGEWEESHYHVYLDLFKRRDEWECFNVPTNPTTEGYRDNEYIYRLSLALDASYCYLLQTIDRVWVTPGVDHDSKVLRQYLIRNIHSIMMDILTPISDLLVQLPLSPSAASGSGSQCAAPCFNYYPKDGVPLDADTLFNKVKEELRAAMNTPRGKEDGMKAKVGGVLFSMRNCGPRPGMADDEVAVDVMDVDL